MKPTTKSFAVAFIGAALTATFVMPAQAAPGPTVVVSISDVRGTNLCNVAVTVRGLEPNSWYQIDFNSGGGMGGRYTDARGSDKNSATGAQDIYNKTVTTSVTTVGDVTQSP